MGCFHVMVSSLLSGVCPKLHMLDVWFLQCYPPEAQRLTTGPSASWDWGEGLPSGPAMWQNRQGIPSASLGE